MASRRFSFFTFFLFPLIISALFIGSFAPSNNRVLAAHNAQEVETAAMTKYIVTLKPDAPQSAYDNAKKEAINEGGKIVDEYSLIKGFVVEYPDDHVSALASNPELNFEADGVVSVN